jgi:hypothetical protein
MGFWSKFLGWARLGATVAGASGAKVKGVPVSVIAEEAEKDGAAIADSVQRIKAVSKASGKQPSK